MDITHVIYDAFDEKLAECASLTEVRAFLHANRPDGFSVWEGHMDDDEFVLVRRVLHQDEMPDDPRVAEALGMAIPEDTPSLGDPWWKIK